MLATLLRLASPLAARRAAASAAAGPALAGSALAACRPLRAALLSTQSPSSAAGAAAVEEASSKPGVAPLRPDYSPQERMLHEKLANQLQATKLNVQDISGGCGSMFTIEIASPMFHGMPLVKQHRIVNDILRDDIKGMHGIQIKTSASQDV
ncbi:hypothetical protein HK105_207761 [Polyrhizophydium stewartii]|uniref:Bola-like protein n=1 Tax=Polyrhizophydium stewartii TaxID=2732419 RepID=A0ABR4MZV9_9FUNG|nr:hypothetical protein HK105_007908 [Polyrhizophydium stewartii]